MFDSSSIVKYEWRTKLRNVYDRMNIYVRFWVLLLKLRRNDFELYLKKIFSLFLDIFQLSIKMYQISSSTIQYISIVLFGTI